YYANYRFPQPYDWYYHYDDNGDYQNENADQGELVTQGEGTTDAKGNLSVTFAAAKGTRGYEGDYACTVKADVVDASRRQISGEGILHVTNQAFYAYLNLQKGFYHAGDKVQIELRTQDADQQPVKTEGTLTVSRLTYEGPEEVATVIHTETLATDAQGKAFTTWASDQSGQFRIDWKARDKFERPVVAQAPVWIEGDDLRDRQFRVGGITLLTDKTTYEEGETAHLLIVADKPDDWVLLTQETGNQILTRSLLHVPGRSRTVDVPIVRAHVPNFALAAVAVRDYQFYSWQQELFVPPSRQFLHMAVTGDKTEYRPGDTGIFHVKTTNAAGLPVASEVSLAVVDSSVFYIQKDYAPDIRLFYYGDRRNLGVNADSSQNISLEGKSESDIAAQKFKPHGIILPEMGRLPGGYYSTYYSAFDTSGTYGGRRGNFVMDGGMVTTYASAGNAVYDSDGPSGAGAVRHAMAKSAVLTALPAPAAPMGNFVVRLADREAGIDILAQRPFAQARVRNFFPDTAFWMPAVVTDKATGEATLSVKFPDTLTTWKASARGLTPGVQVGAGDTQIITNKKLLVRLESPRFFVERDKVTLSAIVRNDLATDKQVRVSLATSGPLAPEGPLAPNNGGTGIPALPELGAGGTSSQTVTVPAHSEKRVDWTEEVIGDGQAKVKMVAETDEESDAVEQSFPALTYGVQKFVTGSGVLQANQASANLTVDIPAAHKAGSAALLVQINPSLAATTLDALPYLADYPYGCVEQTMSRFLPSVLVAKTLREAGVNLDTLHKRALVMQERAQGVTPFGQAKPTDGTTDQTGYTYPTGVPGVMKTVELAESLPHGDRWENPVFDPARLKSMTDEGLSKLVSMQRSDGGWGWWPDSSESDAYMSAYVVYGLATARAAGVDVPSETLSRGYAYLAQDLKNRDDQRDLAVWEAFALSHSAGNFPASGRRVVSTVYAKRDKLSAYGQALLALTLHNLGENDKAQIVCRNLENTATTDRENGTASWKTDYGYWWDWYNNDTETTAWVLQAYVAILPKSDLSPMLVKWLVNNKRGSA
ncbi:MAG: hypothetical protein M3Y13_02360, partial [Armatimonadota bacterium]|nr:hypothetical protein [Armatimonadota bacterium]